MLRLDAAGAVVRFTFEGRAVDAREGDSVAAALVAADIGPVRFSAVSGEPRAPYCMMGVCFECLDRRLRQSSGLHGAGPAGNAGDAGKGAGCVT